MDPQSEAPLRDYLAAKHEVALALRALKEKEEVKASGVSEAIQEFLVKLAEDRFNLVVVGQFKRGKSSLMNAIIGRDLLPTGVMPLTSVITALCYGPKPVVRLRRDGWHMEQESALAELAAYLTEQGNPGNERGIKEARIEVPVPFLRRGLFFVDTPGVGSAQAANMATTYSFLPQVDAAVFVTGVDAPFSDAEAQLLRSLYEQVEHIFIVVNKIDLLSATERAAVLAYLQQQIAPVLGNHVVSLYPLSARQALQAQQVHDQALVEQSGLPALEASLATFLAGERGRVFLRAILGRAFHATNGLPGETPAIAHLHVLHDRLVMEQGTLAATEAEQTPTLQPLEVVIAASQTAATTKPSEGGCPICAAASRAVFAFFAKWQYDLTQDEAAQQASAAVYGLCPAHTWQFQQIASPVGISIGYAPLLARIATEMHQSIGQLPVEAAQQLLHLLVTPATCAACRVIQEAATSQQASRLADLATQAEEARHALAGRLCLPHVLDVLASEPEPEVGRLLLEAQWRQLADLAEDLHNFALKRDALRRVLLNDDEETAWKRALRHLVGVPTARIA